MRHSPDVLDYEGVFPSKTFASRRRGVDRESVFKEIDLDKPSQQPADSDDKKDEKPSFMEVEAGKWQEKDHSLTFACSLFSVSFFTSVLTS